MNITQKVTPLFTIHNNGGYNAIPLANIRWLDLYPHLYAIYAKTRLKQIIVNFPTKSILKTRLVVTRCSPLISTHLSLYRDQ